MSKIDADRQGEMHGYLSDAKTTLDERMQALLDKLASPEGEETTDMDDALYNMCTVLCAILEDEDSTEDEKAYVIAGYAEKLEVFLNEGL